MNDIEAIHRHHYYHILSARSWRNRSNGLCIETPQTARTSLNSSSELVNCHVHVLFVLVLFIFTWWLLVQRASQLSCAVCISPIYFPVVAPQAEYQCSEIGSLDISLGDHLGPHGESTSIQDGQPVTSNPPATGLLGHGEEYFIPPIGDAGLGLLQFTKTAMAARSGVFQL